MIAIPAPHPLIVVETPALFLLTRRLIRSQSQLPCSLPGNIEKKVNSISLHVQGLILGTSLQADDGSFVQST